MAMSSTIRLFSTTPDLVKAAADEIVGTLNRAIGERGQSIVALSGGETPRPVYRMLGSEPYRSMVEWNYVHFFFGDERAVPPHDPQSNFGMIEKELFSRISIPPENVHRMFGEREPSLASIEYEKILQDFAGSDGLRFDLILLGLGDDGHTASLFPGTDAVTATGSLVTAVFVPKFGKWRITLTLECINDARRVIFLVSGKGKADVVSAILGAGKARQELPASLVRPRDGEVIWMLDQDAAGLLEDKT
jgi:6-phosphogluconolactonase